MNRTVQTMLCAVCVLAGGAAPGQDLWALGKAKADVHRYSTLFTASQVRDYLGTEEGIDAAIDWCRKTGVTKVYIEAFRSNYQAERATLERAKARFLGADFEVSGCVTTTRVGKVSTGWNLISCYTAPATQQHLKEIFEYTASIFDEIMIDDFWFTDCTCPECDAARKAQTAVVAGKAYPVDSDSWSAYRCELMLRISRDLILGAAKAVNPNCTVIIKYPQWYEQFHERGYDVIRETKAFDTIWVGTETRDFNDERWGGKAQYEAYFLMRWLGGIGGAKCGGGWFDALGTSPPTYIEQARQTILAGARESMLFCYGLLQEEQNQANVAALRANIPELLDVATEVSQRGVVGVAAYRPPNADAGKEKYVLDFIGMMGIPLVPCHTFPEDAKAAVFAVHAMKDPGFPAKLSRFIDEGKPVLLTDGLAAQLPPSVNLNAPNVRVLGVDGRPKDLLTLDQPMVNALRADLLRALGHDFSAPNKVGLYLFADGSRVIENFNDTPVAVTLDGKRVEIGPRDWDCVWR